MTNVKIRSTAEARIGQIVAERYRLERLVGEGAMGAVYLAEHVHMRKRFALKLLHPHATASPEHVARFEREAIAAGNLSHPNVVAASDFGRLDGDGAFFLVLEYVDGRSLHSVLETSGAMHPRRALAIARQLLSALATAHAKGIVHRDMKPDNVMLVARPTEGSVSTPWPDAISGDELVKVLDFGIAKLDANFALGADTTAGGTPITRAGAVYGTPAYMAPEQAMGKGVDARVDQYAVGCMLYEMLAGQPPFEGDAIQIIAQQITEPPPPVTSKIAPALVSHALHALVGRLLEKDREARFPTAQDAIAALDAIVAGWDEVPPPPPPPPPEHVVVVPPRTLGRLELLEARLVPLARALKISTRQALVLVAGAIVLPLLLILVVASIGSKKPDEADDDAAPRRRSTRVAGVPTVGSASASARPSASSRRSKGSASAPSTSPSDDPLRRWFDFP